jgi:hypothetical protein
MAERVHDRWRRGVKTRVSTGPTPLKTQAALRVAEPSSVGPGDQPRQLDAGRLVDEIASLEG